MTSTISTLSRLMVRVSDLHAWVEQVIALQADVAAILLDVETTGLNPWQDQLVLVQIGYVRASQKGYADGILIDWRHLDQPNGEPEGPQTALVRAELQRLFAWCAERRVTDPLFDTEEARPLPVVGHNLPFDACWLEAQGIHIPGPLYDTLVAEHLLTGRGGKEFPDGYALAAVAERRLGITVEKDARDWFIALDERPEDWGAPLPAAQLEYAERDIALLAELYTAQQEAFRRDRQLKRVLQVECEALPAVIAMQTRGIRVDEERWREVAQEKAVQAQEQYGQLLLVLGVPWGLRRMRDYQRLAPTYNAWSRTRLDAQVEWKTEFDTLPPDERGRWAEYRKRQEAEWLGMHPPPERPDTDHRTPNLNDPTTLMEALSEVGIQVRNTKKDTLIHVRDDLDPDDERWAVLDQVLAYREAHQFVRAFGESLLEKMGRDGRLHPTFSLAGPATGRMASCDPNFQNIPRLRDGERLRHCVIPAEGYKLLTADYSNIEMWCVAVISGDETLLSLLREGKDLHAETARRMFGLPQEWDKATIVNTEWQLGKSYRDAGKILNFRTVYGGTVYGLARMLRISVTEAQALQDAYFATFPGVAAWMRERADDVHVHLESRTALGRKRTYTAPRRILYPTWEEEREEEWKWDAIERRAMNTPIQGTSADIIKLALGRLRQGIVARGKDDCWHVIAVVHDEIVLEVPEQDAEAARIFLGQTMKAAADDVLSTAYGGNTISIPDPAEKIEPLDYWAKD